MPVYRHNGGSVTRSHLRVRVGGSAVGAGRRLRTPFVDPPPPPADGSTVYTAEALGAGGWVTGLAISPDGATKLARTDTLGGWRFDTTTDRWLPAVTAASMPAGHAPPDTGIGVQAIAAANSAAFMGYQSSIYKSVDKGATWTVSLLNGPATGPNSNGQRWWNDHMAFDPNDANTCIYGTYSSGVWFTRDGGTTWTQVASGSVPFGASGYGIPCVTIDGSGNFYAAPFGSGIYRSTDHGTSWSKISSDSQFVMVTAMRAGDNGDLIACVGTDTSLTSTASRVYRYRSGAWVDITPTGGRKWRSFAYDPHHSGRVMVQGEGGYIRFSTDYGATWTPANRQYTAAANDVPWLAAANGNANQGFFVTLGGLQFDPAVTDRVWHSQGIGVWSADLTSTLTDQVTWQATSRGIEQLVVNDVIAPTGGSPVVVSWDRPIFLVGETGSAPILSIAAPLAAPVGTAGVLSTTLIGGYPREITYAWSVVSKPVASTGGTFSTPTALSTTFTPDATGTYTLRLTATNTRGTTTADVDLTATAHITGLVLPSGNYVSAPDRANLDITGDLTLQVKVAMANWQPDASVGNIPLIGKNQLLRLSNLGLSMQLSSTTGSVNGNATGALPFVAGSTNWCRLQYSTSTGFCTLATSPDGVTWTIRTNAHVSNTLGSSPLVVNTANLAIGHQGGPSQPYMVGTLYRGQVFSGATLVADFNAEGVTRTGTRTPATYTDSTGLVWTPQGTGWDWS